MPSSSYPAFSFAVQTLIDSVYDGLAYAGPLLYPNNALLHELSKHVLY